MHPPSFPQQAHIRRLACGCLPLETSRGGGGYSRTIRVISAVSRRKVYLEKGGAYWRLRSSGELRSEI